MTTSLIARPLTVRPATRIASHAASQTKKGWLEDPLGQHKFRFHDGQQWTEHTTHFGPVPCLGCR